MNIPEDAVTAAAREGWERTVGTSWSNANEDEQHIWMEEARAALSAAAPQLMAMAWDEGNRFGIDKHCESGCYEDATNNPYRKEAL